MIDQKQSPKIKEESSYTQPNSYKTYLNTLDTNKQEQKDFFDFCQNFYPSQVNEYGLIFDHDNLQKKSQLILNENEDDIVLSKFKIAFPLLFRIFEQTYDLKGIQRKKMIILIQEFIRVQKSKSCNSSNGLEEFEQFIYQKTDKNQPIDFKEIQNCVQAYQQKNQKLPKKLKRIYQIGYDLSNDARQAVLKFEKDIDEITSINERIKTHNIIPLNYDYFQTTLERIQTKEKKLAEFLNKDVKDFEQMQQIIRETKDVTGGIFKKFQTIANQFQHNVKIIKQIEEGKKKLYKSNFEKQKEFFLMYNIQFPFIFQIFEEDINKLSQWQIEFDVMMQNEEKVTLKQAYDFREKAQNCYVFANRFLQNIETLIKNLEQYFILEKNIDNLEKFQENVKICNEIKDFLPVCYLEKLEDLQSKLQQLSVIHENVFQNDVQQIDLFEFLFGNNKKNQMTLERFSILESQLKETDNKEVYKNLLDNKNTFYEKLEIYKNQNLRELQNNQLIDMIEDLLQYRFFDIYMQEFKNELLERVKAEHYFKLFFNKFTNFEYNPDLEILIKFIKNSSKSYENIEEGFQFLDMYSKYQFEQDINDKFEKMKTLYFEGLQRIESIQSQQDIQYILELQPKVKQLFKKNTKIYQKLCSDDKIVKAYKLIYEFVMNYEKINEKCESLKQKVYEQQIFEKTFDELHQISNCFEECKNKDTFITVQEVDQFEYKQYFNEYCQNIYCNTINFKDQLIEITNVFKSCNNYKNVHIKTFVYLDIFFVIQYMGIELQDSKQLQSFLQNKIEGYKRCFYSKKTFNSLQKLIVASQQNKLNSKYSLQLIKQKNIYVQFCDAVKKIKIKRGFYQQKFILAKTFLKQNKVSNYNISLIDGKIKLKLKPLINKSQFEEEQVESALQEQAKVIKPQKLQINKNLYLSNYSLNRYEKKICLCRSKYIDESDEILKVANCNELYHRNCLGLQSIVIDSIKCPVCSFINNQEDPILNQILSKKTEFEKFFVLSQCSVVLRKFMVSENIDFVDLYTKKAKNLIFKIKKYQNKPKIPQANLHNFVACYLDLPFQSQKIEQSLKNFSKRIF